MKKRSTVISFMIFILLTFCTTSNAINLTLNNTPAQVYFSPKGGCTDAIVREIDNATMVLVSIQIDHTAGNDR